MVTAIPASRIPFRKSVPMYGAAAEKSSPDAEVAAAVPDVLDELHHVSRVEHARDDADQ